MQSEAQANANARATPALNARRRLDGTIDRGLETTLFSPYPVGPARRLALGPLVRSLVLSIVLRLGAHPKGLFDPTCLHPNARFG